MYDDIEGPPRLSDEQLGILSVASGVADILNFSRLFP